MTFPKKRTPKVKEFVLPPFIARPDCGSDGGLGVLSIGPNPTGCSLIQCILWDILAEPGKDFLTGHVLADAINLEIFP